jgi:hypothetical protein
VLDQGPPRALLEHSSHPLVREFLARGTKPAGQPVTPV